jgi:hypothetical protein
MMVPRRPPRALWWGFLEVCVVLLAMLRLTTALVALAAGGCTLAPQRGYYVPDGQQIGATLVPYREASDDARIDLRCQGAYVNHVDGRQVLTVHLQFDVARPRSGELRFAREDLAVDVGTGPGQPHLRLPLVEVWSKRERVPGTLVVLPWGRRSFDLFFDADDILDGHVPEDVLVRWTAQAAGEPVEGQVRFVRIPPQNPLAPSDEPLADVSFGMRDGYYMPGRLVLGERRLQPSIEERTHYVFHTPEGWMW